MVQPGPPRQQLMGRRGEGDCVLIASNLDTTEHNAQGWADLGNLHVCAEPGSVGEAHPGSMCAKLSDTPVCVDEVQRSNLGLHRCDGDSMSCIDKVISTNASQNTYNTVCVNSGQSPIKSQMASPLGTTVCVDELQRADVAQNIIVHGNRTLEFIIL